VLPAFGVSTKDAYRWWDELAESGRTGGSREGAGPVGRTLSDEGINDLQAAVVHRHPEIGRIVSALRRHGASQAAMSGSGSAVFGLFPTRTAADRAARAVAARGRRILVTRTVNRVDYQRLAAC